MYSSLKNDVSTVETMNTKILNVLIENHYNSLKSAVAIVESMNTKILSFLIENRKKRELLDLVILFGLC